jgi:CCR4-NOT transcription complex subunit 7/8
MYTPDSVEQLQKAGIDFQRHEEIGISPNDFAELMITSGLVLSHDTRWISFHRCVIFFCHCFFLNPGWLTCQISNSGYDFGYFMKLLTAQSLPTTEDAFFELLKIWFPTVYDIKYLMKASKVLKGGLQEVADDLGVCCNFSIPWQMILSISPGYANRGKPTSRVGFAPHRIHLFQNARNLFRRSHR